MASAKVPSVLGLGNSYQFSRSFDDGLSCRINPIFPGVTGADFSGDLKIQDNGLVEGNAYLFVLADEILPSGKLVRKVIAIPDHSLAQILAANPEIYGLEPQNLQSTASIGEHALGNNNSRYTSASTFPKGAPDFNGRPVYIDIKKVKSAGIKIYSSQEIIEDLDRLVRGNPQLKTRVEKLKSAILHVEGEVLLEGNVPRSAIKSNAAMQTTRYLRYVQVVGIVLTVYDMGNASVKSVRQSSVKPIVAETIRQVGGWGGAVAGIKIGGATGALVGIETGPGAIVTGAIGAVVFGFAGYFGADWIADYIDEN